MLEFGLEKGMKLTKELPNLLKLSGDTVIEMDFLDNLTGTISDVIQNPFGIMLKDISSTGTSMENVEKTFIPMSEITKMDIFKQEKLLESTEPDNG